MSVPSTLLALVAVTMFAFETGRRRAMHAGRMSHHRLHSLPRYHGYLVALSCLLPALGVLCVWMLLEPRIIIALLVDELPRDSAQLSAADLGLFISSIRNYTPGLFPDADAQLASLSESYQRLRAVSQQLSFLAVIGTAIVSGMLTLRFIRMELKARNLVERLVETAFAATSLIALLATAGILLSMVFEALRFFQLVSPTDFLFGLEWSPHTAIREEQVGASGKFGIVPLLTGMLLIAAVAMSVAVPIGLLSAIYTAEFASRRFRNSAKPALEILAGIPTVVYGFFAALIIGPGVRSLGESIGLDVSSSSALAVGLVMGFMIIPLISSLADDAMRAVPASLREGAIALGATRAEMITAIVLPAAMPGIAGAIFLAVSRAIGETMIVVMAAGLAANLTANPFSAVTTLTVQIVTTLVGDQAFDSARTLSAFALGLVLFLLTIALNVAGLRYVRAYGERNE